MNPQNREIRFTLWIQIAPFHHLVSHVILFTENEPGLIERTQPGVQMRDGKGDSKMIGSARLDLQSCEIAQNCFGGRHKEVPEIRRNELIPLGVDGLICAGRRHQPPTHGGRIAVRKNFFEPLQTTGHQ